MPCNSSTLFSYGLVSLSNAKNELRQKAIAELNRLKPKFEDQCPTGPELEKIIATRNALVENIQRVQRRLDKIKEFTEKIRPYPTVVNSIILTLKGLPIPNAYTTAGLTVIFGDLLADAKELVKSTGDGICDFDDLIAKTTQELQDLISQLNALDALIQACAGTGLLDVPGIQSVTNLESTQGIEYKGYTIKIQLDPTSPSIAPRRFAIALNKSGVVVLKGQPSFSSSTKVLIDEIKFRIDQLSS